MVNVGRFHHKMQRNNKVLLIQSINDADFVENVWNNIQMAQRG